MEPPLSVTQLAERLGVSVDTIGRRIRTGQIRAHKLPGKTGAYIIDAAEVDRLTTEKQAAS